MTLENINKPNPERYSQEAFNEIQRKMYRHLYDYGVSITPYVREVFPQGFKTHELYEVLGAYFTDTAKLLKIVKDEE